MTWSDIQPALAHAAKLVPVQVACTEPGKRCAQALTLTLRPELIEGGLAWCRPGAWVRVQRGGGEHFGMLRLLPAAAGGVGFRVATTSGRKGHPVLRLRGFAPLPAREMKPVAVEFDHGADGDDWLELTLPEWARTTESVLKPTSVVGVAVAGKPFVGLGVQGHTETFAGRRGSGPVKGFTK